MKNFTPFSLKIASIILFLFSVTGTFAQNPDLPALSPKLIAQKPLPSIVILVLNNGDNLPITTGSGFFVTEDIIVTNYHVIKNAKLGAFKIYGSDEVYSVLETVGVDAQNDLALLKVKGVKGKPLKMNGTYQISIGDEVFTVSSPKGLEGSFSQGLVSGLRKTSEKDLIQITAPISHGSSGGAILNNQAEVIAVAVGGIDEGQSLNFAVPVKYVQSLVAKRSSLAVLPGKNSFPLSSTPSNSGRTGGQGSSGGLSLPTKQKDKADLGIKNPSTTINSLSLKAPSAVSEIIKSSLPPPPPLKPNQFKEQDLTDDEELHGDVFSVLSTQYEALADFEKIKKGEKIYELMQVYNRDGNVTNQKEITFYDDNTRSEEKMLFTFDSARRTVTQDTYSDGKFKSKAAVTFNSKGEQVLVNVYDVSGNLKSKITTEFTSDFSIDKGCSAENDCTTYYKGFDEKRVETWIFYKNKNLDFIGTWEGNKKTTYNFCHGGGTDENDEELPCTYDGKLAKIEVSIFSRDSKTNLLIGKVEQIRDLDNPNKPIEKESYKYYYKYDSKGNWIEKIEKKEVTKFGETYFEPISLIERKIRYYSDPDAKPSVNKKPTVKRRKN